MRKWRKILDLGKGITAVCDEEGELMIQQYPHLITPISKKLEDKVFNWLFEKEIKITGKKKFLKWLLKREMKREMEARVIL